MRKKRKKPLLLRGRCVFCGKSEISPRVPPGEDAQEAQEAKEAPAAAGKMRILRKKRNKPSLDRMCA
jgi:hypothetical protein